MPREGSISGKVGEVQSTPTAYTLLRRLKDLLTGTILAAGTAIIGRVGHDITTITSGRKVVTTAATRDTLVASTTPAKWVIITAETDNTGVIAVGAVTVVAAVLTRVGIPLLAGDSITLPVDDLLDVYLDSTVSGDGVTYIALS